MPSVLIVGAGVAGLSSALHLRRAGYEVDVFDEQDYEKTFYSPINADCDAASADVNKIVRASYGFYANGTAYQKLALEAMDIWDEWGKMLKDSAPGDFGPLSADDELFVRAGMLRMQASSNLPPGELATLKNATDLGFRSTHYILGDEADEQRAKKAGIEKRMRPFPPGVAEHGVLDMSSGFVYADKACTFALYLAKKLGVRFHLGPSHKFKSLLSTSTSTSSSKIHGIRTVSGAENRADYTILACGAWTPSLLPEDLNGLLEATGGSVTIIEVPEGPLREKYSPKNFPVWTALELGGSTRTEAMAMSEIGGLYAFPILEGGLMKFGFRGVKFTHFDSSSPVSTPVTVRTPVPETRIPVQAFKAVQVFIKRYMPDLAKAGYKVWGTRLCWYNDTVDNDFLIDHVPGKEGLMVCGGGSGHMFKFLPNVGQHTLAALEKRKTPYSHIFAWRDAVKPGEAPRNGLGEGPDGPRELSKQQLTTRIEKREVHMARL
ncbi:hypothetical protein JCM10213_003397 [Rhodosporidiobolus nylandii]